MDLLAYWLLYRLLWEHPYLIAAAVALWYFRDRIPNPARLLGRRRRIARLEWLVALNPENAEDRTELGELLIEAGRAADAAACLEPAVRKAPDSAGVRFLLGLAHLRAGRPDLALAPLEEASALNRTLRYGEPPLRLGEALAALGRWEEAARAFEVHLAVNASSAEGLYRFAVARLALGDTAGAGRLVHELRATVSEAPRFRRRLDRPWLRRARRLRIPQGVRAEA